MIIFTFVVLTVSILAVTYVFLVMPRVTDGADMDLQSTDYAHGGLHSKSVAPYSAEAFRIAKELGYGIELSVSLSRSGEIFATPPRRRYRPQSSFTLCELLELIDGQVPLLIEIPAGDTAPKLCRSLCLILDEYHGAFAVESFDPWVLSFFKKYRPRYARGQMVSGSSKFLTKHLFTNVISRPDFIVTEGALMNEPAFLLATKLFCRRGFVRPVVNGRQYSVCRRRSLYAVFEKIR